MKLTLCLLTALFTLSAQAAPVYRYYNPGIADHISSLNPNEWTATNQGYNLEFNTGNGSSVFFNTLDQGEIPLLRCYTGAGHFVSSDQKCEGERTETFLGFASARRTQYAPLRLYRCFNGGNDHLITTNVGECYNAGFQVENAFLGYVSP